MIGPFFVSLALLFQVLDLEDQIIRNNIDMRNVALLINDCIDSYSTIDIQKNIKDTRQMLKIIYELKLFSIGAASLVGLATIAMFVRLLSYCCIFGNIDLFREIQASRARSQHYDSEQQLALLMSNQQVSNL